MYKLNKKKDRRTGDNVRKRQSNRKQGNWKPYPYIERFLAL